VTPLRGVLAMWNYHLPPISAQIRNKDNTSALCVNWCIAHWVNNPTSGKTLLRHDSDLGCGFKIMFTTTA